MSSWCCRGGCVKAVGSMVASRGCSRRVFCIQGGEEMHGDHCQPFLFLGRQQILSFWECAALPLFKDLVISVIVGWAGLLGECHCLGSSQKLYSEPRCQSPCAYR